MKIVVAVILKGSRVAKPSVCHNCGSTSRLKSRIPKSVSTATATLRVESVVCAKLMPDLMGYIVHIKGIADWLRDTRHSVGLIIFIAHVSNSRQPRCSRRKKMSDVIVSTSYHQV